MITLTMSKTIFIFPCLFLSVIAADPFRHVVVSPHSASEIFFSGIERQVVAPAPVAAVAPAAPLAVAPAAPVAPVAPLAVAPAAPLAVAPAAPVLAKVAVPAVKLSYPQYAFGYSVQDFTTGDNKVAKEVREGGIVKGSYSVADPDGTKRTVNYYADPIHGFNAVVHKTKILKREVNDLRDSI